MVALLVESIIWGVLGVVVTFTRLVARLTHLKRLQIDDYLVSLALCFYITELVSINIVANATTNLLPPGYIGVGANQLTPTDIRHRIYGSKLVLVVEQCQCLTVWLIKACLLIMYHRITETSFPRQNLAVKVLAGYVAFGFVFMEIFYFGVWCRPFHDYWAVPTPNVQCSTALNHLITNAVFNLSSDLAMLGIALPMFIRSHLPLQRKLALSSVFSLGIFVILCAVLNKYYSFTDPFGSEWTFWYVRESSTALLVANLPFTWGLIRRIFGLSDDSPSTARPGHSSRKRVSNYAPNSYKRGLQIIQGLTFSKRGKVSSLVKQNSGSSSHQSDHPVLKRADVEKGYTSSPAMNKDEIWALEPMPNIQVQYATSRSGENSSQDVVGVEHSETTDRMYSRQEKSIVSPRLTFPRRGTGDETTLDQPAVLDKA